MRNHRKASHPSEQTVITILESSSSNEDDEIENTERKSSSIYTDEAVNIIGSRKKGRMMEIAYLLVLIGRGIEMRPMQASKLTHSYRNNR